MAGECDEGKCGYCGREDGHGSDVCRDRLSGKPRNRGKTGPNKGKQNHKKKKKIKEEEDNDSSPPPAAPPSKKRARFDHQPKAKVQKIQRYESGDEDSDDSESEEEEPVRRKLKKITRMVKGENRGLPDPWERKVRTVKVRPSRASRVIKQLDNGDSKFRGIIDSGAFQ